MSDFHDDGADACGKLWSECRCSEERVLEELREENEDFRIALEAIASDRWVLGECQIEEFMGMDEKSIAKKALGK